MSATEIPEEYKPCYCALGDLYKALGDLRLSIPADTYPSILDALETDFFALEYYLGAINNKIELATNYHKLSQEP